MPKPGRARGRLPRPPCAPSWRTRTRNNCRNHRPPNFSAQTSWQTQPHLLAIERRAEDCPPYHPRFNFAQIKFMPTCPLRYAIFKNPRIKVGVLPCPNEVGRATPCAPSWQTPTRKICPNHRPPRFPAESPWQTRTRLLPSARQSLQTANSPPCPRFNFAEIHFTPSCPLGYAIFDPPELNDASCHAQTR